MATINSARFAIGQLVITRGADAALEWHEVLWALSRHASGDWGEVCEEDWQSNDEALELGTRLLSSYISRSGEKFWVITEHDRSVTTFLLPLEY